MLSYSKQFVNEEDIVAVVKVLKSKTLTKGKKSLSLKIKYQNLLSLNMQ